MMPSVRVELDDSTYERLGELAEKNKRSKRSQALYILTTYFEGVPSALSGFDALIDRHGNRTISKDSQLYPIRGDAMLREPISE